MWQDYLVAISQIILAVSLLPTVFSKNEKPPLATSLPTSLALFMMAYSLFFLKVYISAVLTFFNATLWLLIAYQSYLLNKLIGKK